MLPKIRLIHELELQEDGAVFCRVITESGDTMVYSYMPDQPGRPKLGWSRWAYANEPAAYNLPLSEVPLEVRAKVTKFVN
jgi:hypothetical protein